MTIDSGPLRLSLDDGLVCRRIDGGDGRDIEWEPCGPIMDDGLCPPDCLDDWGHLRDLWEDSRRGGHGREAAWSYYERLSVVGVN